MTEALFNSNLRSLALLHRGKVRDIYDMDAKHMLIVTTDRLSAFDVVLPTPIPGKGALLTALSNFWFERTRHLIPNQLTGMPLEQVVTDARERQQIEGRAIVVRKLKALPVEAIVRGYIVGSGWKEYKKSGSVCGIALPAGLREAARPPCPSPCSRRPPRHPWARMMRTSVLNRPSNSSARTWRNRCAAPVSPSTKRPPRMP